MSKRIPWNKGLTKETDERVAKGELKRKQYYLNNFGVLNNSQLQEVKDKISKSHSSQEWKDLVKKTKLERYGDENYNNMEKNMSTKKERYGNSNYNNSEKRNLSRADHIDEINQHISESRIKNKSYDKGIQTLKEKYGSLEEYYKHVNAKSYNTKKINGTLSNYKSTSEIELENKLLQIFSVDDFVYQYLSDEYPFKADFYIKPLDCYIELNASWQHGGDRFDSMNPEHLDKLELWKSRNYQNAIYQWTDLDIRKWNTAIKNNLNYIVIYPSKDKNIVYTHMKVCEDFQNPNTDLRPVLNILV